MQCLHLKPLPELDVRTEPITKTRFASASARKRRCDLTKDKDDDKYRDHDKDMTCGKLRQLRT